VDGANPKAKRLKLQPDNNGLFICPLESCDSNFYKSQRGCRKHVVEKHGWYFYFDEKPKLEDAFPEKMVKPANKLSPTRSKSWDMPSFSDKCKIAQDFINWICSAGGGGKDRIQAQQICRKILKFAKYCCEDVDESFELTRVLLEYCIGSVKLIEKFVLYLETDCNVGKPGIVSYLQSLTHCLDFLRYQGIDPKKVAIFLTSEVFLSRVKQCLRKKMRVEWNTLLSVETLEERNCWATLNDLQNVLPFHETRYNQVVNLAKTKSHSAHDLSFATSFIVAHLFLKVKGSRPMTFQFLTIPMISSAYNNGIIDQTYFKTNEKYGFDSLIFEKISLNLIRNYVEFVRPKLNPSCQYLLVGRYGKQLSNLGDVFGRIVYQAIGKYINPTRYRQIIETESAQRLSVEQQAFVSLDQKHTSNVAKVHYQKQRSQDVAKKANECIKSLLARPSDFEADSDSSNSEIGGEIDLMAKPCSTTENILIKPSESQVKSTNAPERKSRCAFTVEEDTFIARGLKKYGKGKWTRILKDPDYRFHPSRRNATLMMRAKVKKLI